MEEVTFKDSYQYHALINMVALSESFAKIAIAKGSGNGEEKVEGENILRCIKVLKSVLANTKDYPIGEGEKTAKDALGKCCEWFGVDWGRLMERVDAVCESQTAQLNGS